MAEYYLVPKRLGRAAPALGRLAQRLEALLLRCGFRLLGRMPPERASAVTAALFRLAGPHSDKARAVRRNLRVVFPERGRRDIQRLCRQIFGYLGVATAELAKLRQIWEERDERLQFDIAPAAEAHLGTGGGAVFVTAHVGAWQLTNFIGPHLGIALTTVYAAESNPALRRLFLELRSAFQVRLLPSEAGVRPLIRELNAGNCVGLALDTRLDSGEPIPFFGVDAPTNITAARLALRCDAALIPVHAERTAPGHFRVRVCEPIASGEPGAEPAARAIAMTADINRLFERWIRATPEQWMCLKRRWPKAARA